MGQTSYLRNNVKQCLEVMNSTPPELSWKSVTKGRRSKKSVVRSLKSAVKVGNSTSPRRVGDFFRSDSDKFGEVISGQETFDKSENVPLKKRRRSLQSPAPYPWESSLCNQDSVPSRAHSSPFLKDHVQLQYPSFSSGDFSGIELLAAAATMDDGIYDADKKDIPPEDYSIKKQSDASSSATPSEKCLKTNESVNSLSNITVPGGNADLQENNSTPASQSLSAIPKDGTVPKVERKYWDLNTLMDAWNEPYHDSIAGDTSNGVGECRHMEDMKNHGDHVSSKPIIATDGPSSLNIEQDKSASAAVDGICSKLPHLEEKFREPPASMYSQTDGDTTKEAREMDSDDKNSIQALTYADLKNYNQVTSSDATVGISPLSKPYYSSGILKSKEKNDAVSGTVAMIQDGDCSSNMNECAQLTALGGSHTGTAEVNGLDIAASESGIDVQPGTFTLDTQPVASIDSNKHIDGAFLSNSTIADCEQFLELAGTKYDKDSNLPKEESSKIISAETCKSSSAGEQCDKPTLVGRIGLVLDDRCRSDVSQDKHVDGDDLTDFLEGYDSPYEDGELRGSFLYSWEDNEMENECVDYESDGRNGDGFDAADYLGSEIVEGGSEGSSGARRSLSQKISAEGKCKSGPVKHSLKKHFVKDESDTNVVAGKVSKAGSGSTVEQHVEMPVEENVDLKRLKLLDHKNAIKTSVAWIDEYASQSVKDKLQSRIGRSPAYCRNRKDVFFIQQSRPRHDTGLYPPAERDVSPDRYLDKYRSAARGERDAVHQWTSWGSRRRDTTNYEGGEGPKHTRPRIKTGEPANKIDGVEYHEPRQSNYLLKGLHRPVMRRSSVERDEYFGAGRRLPLTRGLGNYRRRGHYSQRPSRDFVLGFEPLIDDGDASVRVPRYLSRTEHSFSPSSGRQTHMPLPRRRSRSRTRSPPRDWQHPQRERIVGVRRLNRSPDYRSEARIRMPFSKPSFSFDYEEGYTPQSRNRFSPQRNCRWVDERNFADNHVRRRSPVFRRTQRFGGVGSSGLGKSDECFRPRRRFSFMGNGGRECKM